MKSREMAYIDHILEKAKSRRNKETREVAFMTARMCAAKYLAKRYFNIGDMITDGFVNECLSVIGNIKTTAIQKMAAKTVLEIKFGTDKANELIDSTWAGTVAKRSDRRMRIWRKEVFDRDNHQCVECGSKKNIVAHHILHWSVDPVNRANTDNGITLCADCHKEEHPEVRFFWGVIT